MLKGNTHILQIAVYQPHHDFSDIDTLKQTAYDGVLDILKKYTSSATAFLSRSPLNNADIPDDRLNNADIPDGGNVTITSRLFHSR